MVAVGGGMTLMGIGSVVARAAEIDGPVLAFNRAWIGAFVFLAVLALGGHRIGATQLVLAAPGGLAYGAQIALFYSAVQTTTVANATMIMAMHPVVVLVVHAVRGQDPAGWAEWLLTATAMSGIGLVVFASSGSPTWSPTGDLLAVGSLVAWSVYFAASKRARANLGAVEYQGLLLVSSAVLLLPAAAALSGTIDPGPGNWAWVAAMVAVPGTGHLLTNWAHPRIRLGLMSQLTLTNPIVSVIVAALVIPGEALGPVQVAGIALVVTSLGRLVQRSGAAVGEEECR